ncbi:MAG: DNA-binding response regulator [Gallionella sp.]|nr:DNA-binding response regulator [Gallionella sp.]
MSTLLCIDSSSTYAAMISEMAAQAGFQCHICTTEQAGADFLSGNESCSLMIVASELDDGEGINLIRNARLLPSRAAMPIIFLVPERNMDLAQGAMHAGATEVFLRSNDKELAAYISNSARETRNLQLYGRALVVEDCENQAAYVELLCNELGLEADLCTTVEQGIDKLSTGNYQVAIIDVVLLGIHSGLVLVKHIRHMKPPRCHMPIIVMSGFDDVARRIEALRSGATDYLMKPFIAEEFVWRLSRAMQNTVLLESVSNETGAPARWQGLSAREGEICERIMQGYSDKQIAAELFISFWTVRTHIGNIFSKIGVINRHELVARYRQ